jgi:ABC-type nitrate/sulfonate/bicarbonate transport system substrate-binding protein
MLHCVRLLPARIATALVAAMAALLVGEAAADSLRVGRPSARGFAGVPLVTGVKHGFFRAQGLDLELAVFGGGRTSQAMTAGAVDISVQSGTEMAFLAKGVPGKAVAALAGPPNELVLVVRPDLPIRSASTVAVQVELQEIEADIANSTYDEVIPEFSLDGKFDPKALAALGRSFVELDYLPKEPDMTALYTEEFLPKR